MRHRAAIVKAACPELLVDTDDWAVPNKRDVARSTSMRRSSSACPSLYYATELDLSGEQLDEEDYRGAACERGGGRGERRAGSEDRPCRCPRRSPISRARPARRARQRRARSAGSGYVSPEDAAALDGRGGAARLRAERVSAHAEAATEPRRRRDRLRPRQPVLRRGSRRASSRCSASAEYQMVLVGDNNDADEELTAARTFLAMHAPGVILTPVEHRRRPRFSRRRGVPVVEVDRRIRAVGDAVVIDNVRGGTRGSRAPGRARPPADRASRRATRTSRATPAALEGYRAGA